MSWNTLDPDIRETAELVLTRKQLDVLKLRLADIAEVRIAYMLSISRRSVRTHLEAAHLRLDQAGIARDASGRYYRKDEAA